MEDGDRHFKVADYAGRHAVGTMPSNTYHSQQGGRMPLFGAHMSIAGGYHNALLIAQAHACDTVQLFTKNANQWNAPEMEDDQVRTFRLTLRKSRLKYPMAHDSYLINLATPDDVLYRKSIEAFVVEFQRAERLGLKYLVMHPGAHMQSGEESGLARVAGALDEVHARCRDFRVKVLLENTAGQGTTLGWRFEQLAKVLEAVAEPRRLGVCLDTCHIFAAGYALSPRAEYEATLRECDRHIGLKRVRAFHLNDSLKPLGSRVDRHAHIGRGRLGLEPFRLLVNDSRFRDRPMVLETPKEEGDNDDMDRVNLGVLRGLVEG
jgi:deoxyribonuclease-4